VLKLYPSKKKTPIPSKAHHLGGETGLKKLCRMGLKLIRENWFFFIMRQAYEKVLKENVLKSRHFEFF
jgi:hypothetical protein